jgi:cytochrome c oxidase assembly protein subunit 15
MDPNRELRKASYNKDDKLWVANGNFKTQNIFNKQQWRLYTKHDYALFTETWIEYINRLVEPLVNFNEAIFIVIGNQTKK